MSSLERLHVDEERYYVGYYGHTNFYLVGISPKNYMLAVSGMSVISVLSVSAGTLRTQQLVRD